MRSILLAALICLSAQAASAYPWRVHTAESTLTFTATQAGESFRGAFTRFTPVIDFDPAHPENGRIAVTVDMTSATAEGAERHEALPTADWFSVAQFPTATFVSSSIARTADQQFAAQGTLTLRGVTRPLTLRFTLTAQGTATLASGGATLNRSEHGVGQGRWADDQWVGFPVAVAFRILATPEPHQ